MADETKKLSTKEKLEMERKAEEMLRMQEEELQALTDKELEMLKRYKEAGKIKKDSKPKKNPIGADLLYAKKGGLVKKKKSKVAGKLAKRGYGKAMKGKK